MRRFWVACISKEHILRGIAGGFVQVCHGKLKPLGRMSKGDYILVYSSKVTMDGKEKLQCFTALGEVADKDIYRVRMAENFIPFRRNVRFFACKECPIVPLIDALDFIENKKMWGYPFRSGFFEIAERDFRLIASKMITHDNDRSYIRI